MKTAMQIETEFDKLIEDENKEYYINELKRLTNYFEDTLRLKLTNETLQDIIFDFTENSIKIDKFLIFYRKNYFQDKYCNIKYTPISKFRAIIKDYLKAKEKFIINYYDNDFKQLQNKLRSVNKFVIHLEKKKDGSVKKFYEKNNLSTLVDCKLNKVFSINELDFLNNYKLSFILENYETQNFKNLFINFKLKTINNISRLKNNLKTNKIQK